MSPDRILRQAARILASDPGLKQEFFERVGGPVALWEFVFVGPISQRELFVSHFDAVHEGAWRAFNVLNSLEGYSRAADHVQRYREEGEHEKAIGLFNTMFPATPIRIRQVDAQ